jgi:EAL domain/GAF domain
MGTYKFDPQEEAARLAALTSTGMLDSEPESRYDAITGLSAQYFRADTVLLGFADRSQLWIKSFSGQSVQELPREHCVFDLVLAKDGPVVLSNVLRHAHSQGRSELLKQLGAASIASAPVRSIENKILGVSTVFWRSPRHGMEQNELLILQSLADMVASELELRRLRNLFALQKPQHPPSGGRSYAAQNWPSRVDLSRALDQHQFVFYYQPEIELSTRKIVGFEALIRWVHPERGVIPPMDFILVAEQTELILLIGDWGLREACTQIQKWCRWDSRHCSLRVSINLCARQFTRNGLANHVHALLTEFGISSRQLGLEITESSMVTNMEIALK